MREDKIINKPLDIPFKEFMPGQIIQSVQFNDDMKDIEDKVNEIVDKHNLGINKLHDHLEDLNNPHNVTPHQIGTYTNEEIDEFVDDIKNGNLFDKSISNRVLDDECVDTRVIQDGSVTVSKVDPELGSQLNLENNISITSRYTKEETDAIIRERVGDGTYSREEIDSKFEEYQAGTIVDGTISVDKLKYDVGTKLDISANPSITDRYTKAEVNNLIQKNGLPKDWGGLGEVEEVTPITDYGYLPIADVMTADEFIAPLTPVLDIDVKENVDARGEYSSVGDRLNKNDEKQEELSSQLEHKANKKDLYLNIKDFGAKGDGITDDREAIQNAIDYLEQQDGGSLFFPYTTEHYKIGSYIENNSKNVGLVIQSNNIKIVGDNANVSIRSDVSLYSLFYLPSRVDGLVIEDITIDGNNNANYCFYTETYAPYLKFDNVTFKKAIDDNVYLKTFVSTLNKVRFLEGKVGIRLLGDTNNITTSVLLNNCYANSNSEIGYKLNDVTYSTMNSCACDNTKIGYDLSVRGFSLNGCGCEATQKPIKFSSFRGATINGFYIFNCGGKDEDNKTKYLVEYVTGKNATISGLMFENIYNYEYKLGLTSSNYGFENITIVDDSVDKNECYYVTNYKFKEPLKLLRDETTKDITISCSLNDLSTEFKKLPTEINHTVTITINEGTLENYPVLENKKGSGKIIIDLNGYDIKPTNPSSYGLRFKNVDVNVFVKNGTISQTAVHNYGEVVRVENSKLISLNNLALNNVSGNKGGACVGAWNGSIVVVNNCTCSGMFESDGIFTKLNNDGTSILNGSI